ncbi:MAG: Flp pilus assembly complex ATPase component TadA [Deltaproteobacteria bacterium]|nr:Flp pilus assembly complex ATPase component TadA [Deltaproteobacteria bacterium]
MDGRGNGRPVPIPAGTGGTVREGNVKGSATATSPEELQDPGSDADKERPDHRRGGRPFSAPALYQSPPRPDKEKTRVSGLEPAVLARKGASPAGRRLGLEDVAEACEACGLITARQLRAVRDREASRDLRVHHAASDADPVDLLLSLGITPSGRSRPLDADEVLEAVARQLGVPRVHIDPVRLDTEAVVAALPRAFAQKHAVLVLDPKADLVPVAAADPTDVVALETVRQRIGKPVLVHLAGRSEILRIIREIYGFKNSVAAAERDLDQLPDLQNLEQFFRMRAEGESDGADGHVVRAVDHLLRYALDQRASDIHIEPKRDRSIVRLRIDGILHPAHTFSRRVHSAVISRLKTLARMDIAEKRLPQDGRIKTEHGGKAVEVRVSTLPVAFGEKVVLRIFDPTLLEKGLADLGIEDEELALFEGFLARPHGLLLVTGPTGSGKTTTLYAALKRLATGERNVSTVEDPIENICEEFNQVGVQPQLGLSFASVLRTLLRQDPDVIMVGEIRDAETAKMAVQAALTGHLVLSTLHTNDAPGAVARLLDMTVEPYLLATTLIGVVAQRLVRTPCPYCVRSKPEDESELEALGLTSGASLVSGAGCPKCRLTGYLGRTGIHQVLRVSPDVAAAIHEARPAEWILSIGRNEGMRTLREAGISKALRGVTDLREVLAQAPPDEHEPSTRRGTAVAVHSRA